MITIADLVNNLFRTHRRADGREFSASEVSRQLKGQLDVSTIQNLRRGKATNPTRHTLLLLCQFFNISPTYFFPELSLNPEDASLEAALHATNLDPQVREKLQELIKAMQKPPADS